MPIDEALLTRARDARARMAELERDAAGARAEFEDAVCGLHRAGASLREIADALELSHQRVHQLVRRTGRGARPVRSCSFCGAPQLDARIIAGPGTYICERCVALAREAGTAGAAAAAGAMFAPAASEGVRCTFCGKGPRRVEWIVGGRAGTICEGCVALCEDIVART